MSMVRVTERPKTLLSNIFRFLEIKHSHIQATISDQFKEGNI